MYHLGRFSKIYDAGIRNIQVTFDGAKTKHDSIRIDKEEGASFDTIFKNLRKIKMMAYDQCHIIIRSNYMVNSDFSDLKEFMIIRKPKKSFTLDMSFP